MLETDSTYLACDEGFLLLGVRQGVAYDQRRRWNAGDKCTGARGIHSQTAATSNDTLIRRPYLGGEGHRTHEVLATANGVFTK